MPTRFVHVPPKRFVHWKGVDVYHVYKEDDADDVMTYWFTLDPDNTDSEMCEAGGPFDIRDLPTWTRDRSLLVETRRYTIHTDPRRLALREAIAQGKLGREGN